MDGISDQSKEAITKIVEGIFDRIAFHFLGNIPKLRNKKLLVFNTRPQYGLANLFIQAMQNKTPNPVEQKALRNMLDNSYGYIESLKSKTTSMVLDRIDGLAREASIKKDKIDEDAIQDAINEELGRAKSQLKTVVEAESTKTRNVGSMMNITRIAADIGDEDPTVFFVVVKDTTTCKECIRLHLMPDQVTPKLWKFSELKQGYHKRSDDVPSAFGLHPHCRCTLTYLSKGFGFDKQGKVKYHAENHDAYTKQRSV